MGVYVARSLFSTSPLVLVMRKFSYTFHAVFGEEFL